MITLIAYAFGIFCIMFAVLTFLWLKLAMRDGKLWMYLLTSFISFLMILCEAMSITFFEIML